MTPPNVVHFIYPVTPRTRPFSLLNALAVKMAAAVQRPEMILFWTNAEPSEIDYWNEIEHLVTRMSTKVPESFRGIKIEWPQYASDVMRLEILLSMGGIYMDTDLLLLKPLHENSELIDDRLTISWENTQCSSISNALMAAPPDNKFLREWLDIMPSALRSSTWAYGGVVLPYVLSQDPKLVDERVILPAHFCCPLDLSRPWILENEIADHVEHLVSTSHGIHVFETYWRDRLQGVDREYIKRHDNFLSRLARKYMVE